MTNIDRKDVKMVGLKKMQFKSVSKWIIRIFLLLFILFSIISFNLIRRVIENPDTANDILFKYMLLSIGIFLVLSIIIVISLIFIRRIVSTNMPLMLNSFKDLSNFNFDIEPIINFQAFFAEEKYLKKLLTNIYKEHIFLDEIKNMAANEYVLDDVLEGIFEKLNTFVRVDRIGVAFVDYDKEIIVAETAKIDYGKVFLGPGYKVHMKNTSLTEIIETKQPKFCNDIEKDAQSRDHRNNSLELIMNEGIKSNMIIPLIIQNRVFGFMFFSSFEKNSYDKKSLRLAGNISHVISTIIDQTYLIKKILNNITFTFADLVEKKDSNTGNHITRMANYSKVIAEDLIDYDKCNYKVNTSFVYNIRLYAPLHDIGKIGIPDKILTKPGKLTSEEWAIMKEHTNIGADILVDLKEDLQIFGKDFYQMAIDVTRHHHEKWDGSGYPYGLKGEDIPLSARIIAIADVFDALSSKRPYKEAMPFDEAVKLIKEGSGSHFDPELVSVFINCLPKIRKIYDRDFASSKSGHIKEEC